MLAAVASLDRLLSRSRPLWQWLGQLAVLVLGVHLAADRLDDLVAAWLVALPVSWPDPELPLAAGTWCAIALELAVCGWATVTLLAARAEPVTSVRAWWARASVVAVLAPILWGTAGVTGLWVVQMAVEDLLAPTLPDMAGAAGWLVAGVVGARLLGPGLLRVIRQAPLPRNRLAGAAWAPPVLLVSALAVLYGLPVWGWWT